MKKKREKERKKRKEKPVRYLKVVIMRQDDIMENPQEADSEVES